MPDHGASIKKNFIMNVILSASNCIFPLITYPYVFRVLLPAGTGKVQFATSVIAYFSIIAQLGIPTYGIRACAKIRHNREELTRTVHELLAINLIMNILTYAALAASLFVVPRFRENRLLLAVVSLTILLTSIGMEWLYKALEQYKYITIRSIAFKLIALAATFVLVHGESDYIIYGAISIFAASASNILNLINARKHISFKPVGNYCLCRHIKPVAVFFAMSCAATIYTHLDNVMLGFMATDVDVGYYDAAVKVKTILVSLITSLGVVLLPRSAYYVEHGKIEEFRRITRKALNFVIFLAVPLSVFFMLYAREGILLLSGPAYDRSIIPMQVIMPTLLLIGITNILGIQILVPMGKEKIVLYSEIAGAAIDIVINAILIPKMQATGAAVGTLVAETVVLLVQYYALRNEVRDAFRRIHYLNIIAGVLLGVIASVWVKMLVIGNFPSLIISAILFFGVYGGYLLLRKENMITEIVYLVRDKISVFQSNKAGKE